MTRIIKNVNAQEIADNSVTIIEQLNDSSVYKQYFAVPHGFWITISTYGGENDMSIHGNSISETDAVKQVNSAIEKAKTNPNITVSWGKLNGDRHSSDNRMHGLLTSTEAKFSKKPPVIGYSMNPHYRDTDEPSMRKAHYGEYSERFHGKRTHAPKKNLADTFDKNFRKML